jgi:hypothetical protein
MDTQGTLKLLWIVPYFFFLVCNLIFFFIIGLLDAINSGFAYLTDYCDSKRRGIPIEQVKKETEGLKERAWKQ